MRSGTVPHVLVVGLGEACAVAKEEMKVRRIRACLNGGEINLLAWSPLELKSLLHKF